MQDFEYAAPKTLAEAVRVMAEPGVRTKALAGGTDILAQLRAGRFDIDRLVDIKYVPELNQLSFSVSDGLVLGAAVPCYRIYEDSTIASTYGGLIDSASMIGGIQIQSRASIGGNLCNASPSADAIPALIALEGSCVLAGANGQRTVPVEAFCTGPGRNTLSEGEILVALRLPAPRSNSGAHYLRFIPRNEMDIAVAGVGASVTLDQAKTHFVSARIALAAVGPTPIYAEAAGALLAGKPISNGAILEAAEAAKAAARPIDDMRGTAAQRVHLVGVLAQRALSKALDRALEEG